MLMELTAVYETGYRGMIFIVDDNFIRICLDLLIGVARVGWGERNEPQHERGHNGKVLDVMQARSV
jgi:hypothetical protein